MYSRLRLAKEPKSHALCAFGCFWLLKQLPLAAEESIDPKRDMPKGLTYGIITLIISAFLILLA